MQLQTRFLFLDRSMSIHWDNGWVTSANDRFFDIESAVRAECLSLLSALNRSPDDYQPQLAATAIRVREIATSGLLQRPPLVHRLIESAHRFNALGHARSLLPTTKSRVTRALKRTATYFTHRNAIDLQAAQSRI